MSAEVVRALAAGSSIGLLVFFAATIIRPKPSPVCREYEHQLVWHQCGKQQTEGKA